MTLLWCAGCKQEINSSSFSNSEQRKGRKRKCRPCLAAYKRDYRARNPDKMREYREKPEAMEKRRQYERERNATRRGQKQNADVYYRYRYGLTVAQIDAMIEEQGGVCAICLKPEVKTDPRTGQPRRLSVDHDHRTGLPRQMLCQSCNWILAKVDDSPALLERFVAYLDRHSPKD